MISITFELPSIKRLVLNNLNMHSTVKHIFLKAFFQFGFRVESTVYLLQNVEKYFTAGISPKSLDHKFYSKTYCFQA